MHTVEDCASLPTRFLPAMNQLTPSPLKSPHKKQNTSLSQNYLTLLDLYKPSGIVYSNKIKRL